MSTTESTTRCAYCYDRAAKAGRTVKLTDVCKWPVCTLCESRIRNGLVHYVPSNGTEFMIFEERCSKCRHFNEEGTIDASVKACAWGVMDKILNMQMSDKDSANAWHDPQMLDASTCPATCLKFTHKDDKDGERYDPPPPDCIGQMTFDELNVPAELPAIERTVQRVS